MIPPEKPDIVYLLAGEDTDRLEQQRYNLRIVNMQNATVGDKIPQNSISQTGTAKFDTLGIQNVSFNIENKKVIIMKIKLLKLFYPNKYMFAWKLATDDSFIRGYNSSKIKSRTNVQVILQGNQTKRIIDTTNESLSQIQSDFKQFIGTRAYLDSTKAYITPMMHYLCDVFVRIIFNDSSMPQVLNADVIGELTSGAIKPQ
ncbi:MAG: hypothetical protein EZS28_017097 [Streblomastix strix]|uniref:Uncharacterized protein n=1 Tax=Streblomastix strix TaxID=222440 RepID=A0A5J4VXL4_9EUKA|nr:MAG: hypothetical protein EZS28_017097 [Streblomastix strix]